MKVWQSWMHNSYIVWYCFLEWWSVKCICQFSKLSMIGAGGLKCCMWLMLLVKFTSFFDNVCMSDKIIGSFSLVSLELYNNEKPWIHLWGIDVYPYVGIRLQPILCLSKELIIALACLFVCIYCSSLFPTNFHLIFLRQPSIYTTPIVHMR